MTVFVEAACNLENNLSLTTQSEGKLRAGGEGGDRG